MTDKNKNFESNESRFNAIFSINATPTKVSELENDLDYQTEEEVTSSIQSATEAIEIEIGSINETLQSYGDIVTHNTTEFATATEGTLATTALQPNDNITELVNNAGYITSASVGEGNLTIQRNSTALGTFSANATEAMIIDISVPVSATDVGALPSTTTITNLASTTQMLAINSGATTTNISQIATNTSAISTINSKIPSAATTTNQLADKNFVNSSISTNTANFIGTFNSVADLEAYSGTLTNNDYAFVVTTDSAGNTLYDRYKYNGSQWLFEYELNNSNFTSGQWAAINSGVTSSTVSAVAANTSAITTKQDLLTAGANIQITSNTISATVPTIVTSVSASSTNAETVGAKLFYDTCGDIETLINAL